MHNNRVVIRAICGLALLLPGIASAAIAYDETASGDFAAANLESSGVSPGTFAGIMTPGVSTITGSFGNSDAAGRDTDVFSFEIPVGQQLTAIDLTYTPVSGDAGGGSYFGIQGGLEIGTGFETVGSNLSNALIRESEDILSRFDLGPEFGGTGLTAPLGAGNYTMFMSETHAVVDYQMDFNVSAVPEPETYAMLLAGLGLLGAMARRKKTSPGK
ncbi:PEP-CTERM protein-sorting domain-containing protein [Nitrosospira sp. Nl5]|uniref:FxDxF family PEP-CTERM protein n=1 Tax=Nitrosospira sp. Nl5 TaxID=200120 RepID=UPI00088200B1|nr:FxDxF family PEP-CTERM protein [Nitrosospira sp. Nl5]SCY29970.1 PEP-CTERM protein-sorting domain-containing protein [Nitrosospira sp. Nl5]